MKHGAEKKRCSREGCTNQVVKGGVCVKHGAEKKRCSSEGCINYAKRRGVCWRHGAHHATNNNIDESTAFGSEFEQTTVARSQSIEHATRPPVVARGVPGEVTILCQEIVEV